MAKITINGESVHVKNGISILKACDDLGIRIPTLCFLEEINEIGFCRLCVVEVEGEQDLISACNTEVTNGMVIETDSETVINSRVASLQLLAGKHRFDCWKCSKDGHCEFYDLLKEYDVTVEDFGGGIGRKNDLIEGIAINMDQTKCVLCKRCVAVCQNVVTANVLKFRDDDGLNPFVSPTPGLSFDDAGCIHCGQCIQACPTGTLFETDHIQRVRTLIRDKSKTVFVQIAPEVAVSLGEEFGYQAGYPVKEIQPKMYRALQLLGFDDMTDMAFSEDVTVLEDSAALIDRIKNGGKLPMFSSSCAGWVRYSELYRPEYLDNLSTAKSPHMMQGAMLKGHYAPTYLDVKPEDVAVVSVMPCTAKKYEISRPEMEVDGNRDVDAVLTVRELAKLIKMQNIDFRNLDTDQSESKLIEFTGSASPFETGSGLLESVLNTVSDTLEKKPLGPLSFEFVHGAAFDTYEGFIKETTTVIDGITLNCAVVHGGAAIKEMYKKLDENNKQYHYIEFMACPLGCVNGGGMPTCSTMSMDAVIDKRVTSLNAQDTKQRQAQKNPATTNVYESFLEHPNSEVTHKYLHTHYSQKDFRKE